MYEYNRFIVGIIASFHIDTHYKIDAINGCVLAKKKVWLQLNNLDKITGSFYIEIVIFVGKWKWLELRFAMITSRIFILILMSIRAHNVELLLLF